MKRLLKLFTDHGVFVFGGIVLIVAVSVIEYKLTTRTAQEKFLEQSAVSESVSKHLDRGTIIPGDSSLKVVIETDRKSDPTALNWIYDPQTKAVTVIIRY